MNAYLQSLIGQEIVGRMVDGADVTGVLELDSGSGLYQAYVTWHKGKFPAESVLWITTAAEAYGSRTHIAGGWISTVIKGVRARTGL